MAVSLQHVDILRANAAYRAWEPRVYNQARPGSITAAMPSSSHGTGLFRVKTCKPIMMDAPDNAA